MTNQQPTFEQVVQALREAQEMNNLLQRAAKKQAEKQVAIEQDLSLAQVQVEMLQENIKKLQEHYEGQIQQLQPAEGVVPEVKPNRQSRRAAGQKGPKKQQAKPQPVETLPEK